MPSERAEQLDREMNEPVRQPLSSCPKKSPCGQRDRESDGYRLVFWNKVHNCGEYFQAHAVLQIGTDSEGGARPERTLLVVA